MAEDTSTGKQTAIDYLRDLKERTPQVIKNIIVLKQGKDAQKKLSSDDYLKAQEHLGYLKLLEKNDTVLTRLLEEMRTIQSAQEEQEQIALDAQKNLQEQIIDEGKRQRGNAGNTESKVNSNLIGNAIEEMGKFHQKIAGEEFHDTKVSTEKAIYNDKELTDKKIEDDNRLTDQEIKDDEAKTNADLDEKKAEGDAAKTEGNALKQWLGKAITTRWSRPKTPKTSVRVNAPSSGGGSGGGGGDKKSKMQLGTAFILVTLLLYLFDYFYRWDYSIMTLRFLHFTVYFGFAIAYANSRGVNMGSASAIGSIIIGFIMMSFAVTGNISFFSQGVIILFILLVASAFVKMRTGVEWDFTMLSYIMFFLTFVFFYTTFIGFLKNPGILDIGFTTLDFRFMAGIAVIPFFGSFLLNPIIFPAGVVFSIFMSGFHTKIQMGAFILLLIWVVYGSSLYLYSGNIPFGISAVVDSDFAAMDETFDNFLQNSADSPVGIGIGCVAGQARASFGLTDFSSIGAGFRGQDFSFGRCMEGKPPQTCDRPGETATSYDKADEFTCVSELNQATGKASMSWKPTADVKIDVLRDFEGNLLKNSEDKLDFVMGDPAMTFRTIDNERGNNVGITVVASRMEIASPIDKVGFALECKVETPDGTISGFPNLVQTAADQTAWKPTISPKLWEFSTTIYAECIYYTADIEGIDFIYHNKVWLTDVDTKAKFTLLAMSQEKFDSEQRNFEKKLSPLDKKAERFQDAKDFFHFMYPGDSKLFEQKIGSSYNDWNPDTLPKFLPIVIIQDEPYPIVPLTDGKVFRYLIRFEKPQVPEREQKRIELDAKIISLSMGLHTGVTPQPGGCDFIDSSGSNEEFYTYYSVPVTKRVTFDQLKQGLSCITSVSDRSQIIDVTEAEVPITLMSFVEAKLDVGVTKKLIFKRERGSMWQGNLEASIFAGSYPILSYYDDCREDSSGNDCGRKHDGIDIKMPVMNVEVFAPFDGEVSRVGCHTISGREDGWGLGERITIVRYDGDVSITFGHLSSFNWDSQLRFNETGAKVAKGDLLGFTGDSMGCYLGCTNLKEGCQIRCEAKCREDQLTRIGGSTSFCYPNTCGIPGGTIDHLHIELRERSGRAWIPFDPTNALIDVGSISILP